MSEESGKVTNEMVEQISQGFGIDNRKNPRPDLPAGWRFLEAGESMVRGDYTYDSFGQGWDRIDHDEEFPMSKIMRHTITPAPYDDRLNVPTPHPPEDTHIRYLRRNGFRECTACENEGELGHPDCPVCEGMGLIDLRCETCGGDGEGYSNWFTRLFGITKSGACPDCNGTGKMQDVSDDS